MRKIIFGAALGAIALIGSAAEAQLPATSFRGFRLEGNVGGDRFQSQGIHNDKFGYGATIGWDGMLGDHIVIGPEASFWRARDWSENCTPGVIGGSVCTKSFQEVGGAIRIGYALSPKLLVFGKGGYVNNEQRKRFTAPPGETSYYHHYNSDGYQVGGGAELSLTPMTYVNAQYVFSKYDDHTSRQRVMAGFGVRFK